MALNVTLRQLQVFSAVARLGSFTRAAEALHLSQPAVSMQVKQLEAEVELALFEQAGRRISLTEAGEEVHAYARAVEAQVEELATVLDGLKGLESGRLRIAIATSALHFAPALLGEFHQRHPGVAVSLDVTNRQTLLGYLNENTVDLVIMGRPPSAMDLEAERLRENPLVIIAAPDHALVARRGIPVSELADEAFLVREQGSGTRAALERTLQSHGAEILSRMEVSSDEAIKQGVGAGLGLGLMAREAIKMEVALGRLAELDVEGFPLMRHWYVVHRRGRRFSTVAQAFKSFLVEQAALG